MHQAKREKQPAFCPSQWAQKSARVDRIEWPASRAFVARSVNRTFVRTTGPPRGESGRTAWELKSGTNNLDIRARKKSSTTQGGAVSRPPCRRPTKDRRSLLGARAQRDHFPQHTQAVAEKTHFAARGMIPTHWNFANLQTGPMRAIKQL